MFLVNLSRILRAGFIQFRRQGVVSAAAVLVITITLAVMTALIFLQVFLHFALAEIENKVDVTVYFQVGTSPEKILVLKDTIDQLPEVASSLYISAEEALERFKERHKDDYLTLQALEELGENPLGASLNIKALDVSQYEGIARFLDGDSLLAQGSANIIDKINYYQNELIINRLNTLINGAQRLGFLVTLILIVVSVAIVFNTIRLAIYISREEIKIMRLVGASNSYIRGPFLVGGILYGVISAVLAMIIFYPITLWVGNNMSDFLGLNMFSYYTANFFQIFIIILTSGVLLGTISSALAVRKFLVK